MDDSQIAIIGMSGRFPGAKSIGAFWNNLRDGVESITFFTNEQLIASGVTSEALDNPNYVKARPVLEDVELFDAPFFGFSPRDAECMDPQHRLFLECVWEAIENAGYDAESYKGAISVYAGANISSYLVNNLHANPKAMALAGEYQSLLSNMQDSLTTRIAYKLNLKGPCYTLQTFCSTSLVAVHVACQSLLNFECDMAVSGGVSVYVPQNTGYWYQEGMIVSPDGHCRPFDAKAQGTIFGNGLGAVVLKRLEDALADGDHIEAVIIGSAANNDGSLKVSYTAPSVAGQAEVIVEALANAGVEPETITYVETHGTATALGDPTEVAALTRAFHSGTQKRGFCAIGSVKSNIGHLDAAGGVAGLIKAVLALKHKEIPPSLHFEKPNPNIDFESSPFYVNSKLSEWESDGTPRRAGVSAFGVGGTNAHVIVQEAPLPEPSSPSRPHQLLVLSAKTSSALETATKNLIAYFREHPELKLPDTAYTLQVGRKAFNHRRMIVCHNVNDAMSKLDADDQKRMFTLYQEKRNPPVAFMFSGQGAQYVNMGLEIYRTETTFQKEIDRCSDILKPHLGLDLRDILYPAEEDVEEAAHKLKQTFITQPVLFVIEYALAKLWMSWGVHPEALVGHSIGEYVAACLAGVLLLEDALSLVATRGRLIQELPRGSMLAVLLSEEEIQPFLDENLSLAAINGPSICTVSGEKEAIENLEEQLSKKNVGCRHLRTSHAFHSNMVEPILDTFAEQVKQVRLNPPQIPFVSNVTGTWITPDEAMNPSYWARHLRQTVRFSDCVQELLKEPNRVLLEVGPGQTLSTLARQHSNRPKEQIVLSSIRHPKEQRSDIAFILTTLGKLWLAGIEVDWSGFYKHEQRHRLALPTYPFERQRYWIEPAKQTVPVDFEKVSLNKRPDPAEWFYAPTWTQVPKRETKLFSLDRPQSRWLLFMDQHGLGSQLLNLLQKEGHETTAVFVGEKFAQLDTHDFAVNPNNQADYFNLIRELKIRNRIPHSIIHLWCISAPEQKQTGLKFFEHLQPLGFYSLLYLCKAFENCNVTDSINIGVIVNKVHKVIGSEDTIPEKATILGPCKVIPQEYPNISFSCIDAGFEDSDSFNTEKLTAQLLSEFTGEFSDPVVAYRDGHRWIQTFESVSLDEDLNGTKREFPETLRQNGVYLITGGLGNVGLVIAGYLAKSVQAKLVLIGRSGLPPQEKWEYWLDTQDASDIVSQKIQKVQSLEQMGAEVLIIEADVSNEDQMMVAINRVYDQFGSLNGVIHAAGIGEASGLRFIREFSRVDAEKHFLPKVHGLYVLQKLLKGKQLDFCQGVSSIASILGGLGYSAYSAANIFMDAFVQQQRTNGTIPWMSVNWDAWRFKEDKERGLGSSLAKLAIMPEEGLEVLQHVLSMENRAQLVVSTADLDSRVNQWIKLETLRKDQVTVPRTSAVRPSGIRSEEDKAASMDQVEQTIAHIYRKLLGIGEEVGFHDDFFELGGSSLTALRLFAEIEKIFGKRIPLAMAYQASTVKQLARIVRQKEWHPNWSSLIAIQANGSKPPLFLIHGAEGNILLYRELAHHLGPDQPVYGLQAQGLDGRTDILTRIEDMAVYYIKEIQTLQPEGPYYLGGYCLGGAIALEMAQQLHAQGDRVNLVAMFETYNPQSNPNLLSINYRICHMLQNIVFHCENLLRLKSKDKLKFLIVKARVEKSRMKSGISRGLSKIAHRPTFNKGSKYPEALLKKVNDQAFFSYKPRAYPGRVTLFRPKKYFFGAGEPQFGWDGLPMEGLDVYKLPVNPKGMLVEPYVKLLADKLKSCIQKASESDKR